MEPKLLERASAPTEHELKSSKQNSRVIEDRLRVTQAQSDLASLEKSYRSSSRTLQSMVFGLIAAVLVLMAYSLFGGRVDREIFTTDVTPIHVELYPVTGHKQTAQNPRNMQL